MNQWVFLIVSLMLSVVGTFTQMKYKEQLDKSSAELTIELQKMSTSISDTIVLYIADLTAGVFVAIGLFLYILSNRFYGVVGVFSGLFASGVASLMKLVTNNPRPFWKFEEVIGMECYDGFSTPSGHALSASAFIFSIGWLWVMKGSCKVLKSLVLVLGLVLAAFNRVYLGSHYYFDLVLGVAYGMLLAGVLLLSGVSKALREFPRRRESLVVSQVICFGMLGASFMIFFFRDYEWQDEWNANFSEHCKGKLDLERAKKKNFFDSLVVVAVAGFMVGYYLLDLLDLPRMSFKVFLVSVLYLVLGGGAFLVADRALLMFFESLWLAIPLIFLRCLAGFFAGYIGPILVHKTFGEPHTKPAHSLILN